MEHSPWSRPIKLRHFFLFVLLAYLYLPKRLVHVVVVVSTDTIPTVCGWTMCLVRLCVRHPTLAEKLNGEVLLLGLFGSFITHLN